MARSTTPARDKRSMCCTCPGHLSVRVGDSLQCCEEIVKKSQIAPLNAFIIIIIIIIRCPFTPPGCTMLVFVLCHAFFLCVCFFFLSFLTAQCLSHMQSISQGWICLATIRRQKLQIKLAILPCHCILTPGQLALLLNLKCLVLGRVVKGVPTFKSLVWLNHG